MHPRTHIGVAHAHAERDVKGKRERFTRAKQGSGRPVRTMRVQTAAAERGPAKVTRSDQMITDGLRAPRWVAHRKSESRCSRSCRRGDGR